MSVNFNDSPFELKISFHKLKHRYEIMAKKGDEFQSARAKKILETLNAHPEFIDGFENVDLLRKYEDEIKFILEDSFSEILTENEIKAASIPFENIIFNSSKRFKKILQTAGEGYELTIRNMPEGHMYIMACTVILAQRYKTDLQFKRPLFYDIPDANGIMRHYRIMYNADFMEVLPTDKAVDITDDDIAELLDNFDNIKLWKEKFPPNSWLAKGFVITNIFDVTMDTSISDLKTTLLEFNKEDENYMDNFQEIFQSLFNIKDLKVGFSAYNPSNNTCEKVHGGNIRSFILDDCNEKKCEDILCGGSYETLLSEGKYFSISDVEKFNELSEHRWLYKALNDQGIKSAILAPILNDGKLLGILELVSPRLRELNSVIANKLLDVIPYLTASILRSKAVEENQIEAIIQHECTTIHESVFWKFKDEAKRFLRENNIGNQTSFQEIVFKDVYPLYGQVDIKESSIARNESIQKDLINQLTKVDELFEEVIKHELLPIFEEIQYRTKKLLDNVKQILNTDSEQNIQNFIAEDVQPILGHLKESNNSNIIKLVKEFEITLDNNEQGVYNHRKNYDESVTLINKTLASLIDDKQKEAQKMFPHYFERYKTDGVEHNMYIGASIANNLAYRDLYLNNLRLWQLQVMCEMENAHYNLKAELPIKLDVASLILVYSTPLSIRFRMDEKRFDVDGTYNARYEILKKRLDKALIKGTNERVTQKGKIAIVYSQKKDEREYLRYIKLLQSKKYFTDNIKIVELEGLQGVSGLKAIIAEVLYKTSKDAKEVFTYNDLMDELKLN